MPDINITPKVPGERIIELALEITLEAVKKQTPEQAEKMWTRHLEDVQRWREFWDKFFGVFKPRD